MILLKSTHERELQLLATVVEAKESAWQRERELLEKELNYYRQKFEEAQERADRLHDALLVHQAGVEPVTEVGRQVREAEQIDRKQAQDLMAKQLEEIFSDSMSNLINFDESNPETEEVDESVEQESDLRKR